MEPLAAAGTVLLAAGCLALLIALVSLFFEHREYGRWQSPMSPERWDYIKVGPGPMEIEFEFEYTEEDDDLVEEIFGSDEEDNRV